jgi:hypothetical protein
MIAYRDFRPEAPGLFPRGWQFREGFDAALAEANDWIERESVDVLSVETLGCHEAAFEVRSIRVWYRTSSPKPRPTPEV